MGDVIRKNETGKHAQCHVASADINGNAADQVQKKEKYG